MNGTIRFPKPQNAPFVNFEKKSAERKRLAIAIDQLRNTKPADLPLWIGGQSTMYNPSGICVPPHDFKRKLALYAQADNEDIITCAINCVMDAKHQWELIPWHLRLHIFRHLAIM